MARATLPEKGRESVLWDDEVTGFGLRLREATKTWIVSYRATGSGRSGPKQRFKLGSPQAGLNTANARRLAKAALGRVAAGYDPQAERVAEKRRSRTRIVDLLDLYDQDLERRSYVNRVALVRNLRTKLGPLVEREISDVTGAEYAAIVQRLDADGLHGAAEQFRATVKAFLSFCVTQAKVLAQNPLEGFRRQRSTRADRLTKGQHGRALSDAELVKIWMAADLETMFGRVVRYLILTGCRRNEAAILRRDMLDRRKGWITLPAAETKQGRDHILSISPLLADVLDACPETAGSPYVFASLKTGGKISGWKQMREKIEASSKVSFMLHDLRRTCRTGMSRLGVDDVIAELAIGHAQPHLQRRYNRNEARAAIRAAFEKWDHHVAKIVAAAAAQALHDAGGGVFS